MPPKSLLLLLTFISATCAIYLDLTGNHELFTIFKPLTSVIIITIPLLYNSKSFPRYTLYIISALFFCLVGDILLLNNNYFVFGLVAFLIGHILFTLGFTSISGIKRYPQTLIILLIIGGAYYAYLFNSLSTLAIPVFIYFIFITLMCWQGIGLYIWKKRKVFLYVAISVVLFLISDSTLALNKFKVPFEASRVIVLATYWLSIALLANSTTMIVDEDVY